MSSLAISHSASTTLPAVEFHAHGHGHKKGMSADSLSNTSGSTSTTGQPPVGAAQGLFASLLQTLEQVIGVQPPTAATATTAAGGTSTGTAASAAGGTASAAATAPTVAQNLNGFLHSLFQVLKQEEAGTGPVQGTGINGAPAVTGAATAGQYQGSLASSLQALIQQVGSTGPASPAIANLDNSFSNLINGLNGGASSTASTASTAGAGGATATPTSNAALQSFLNNLLQNLQANGLQAPNLTGTNVNANV